VKFYYDRNEPGGQILSWFKLQLKAIGTLWDAGPPEAALTVIYSGIDSFGLLAAPPDVLDANRTTYKRWCEKYILPLLRTVEGTAIAAVDLYAARCGVLHTSTPLSSLERECDAHQVFYQFKDKTGVNMLLDAKQAPIRIDIGNLGLASKRVELPFSLT
jgi:hypothetical protein